MIWRCPLSSKIHARFKYEGFGRRQHQIPAHKRERGGVTKLHARELADCRATDKWALNACWPDAIARHLDAGHDRRDGAVRESNTGAVRSPDRKSQAREHARAR